jgi:hypothetical protein
MLRYYNINTYKTVLICSLIPYRYYRYRFNLDIIVILLIHELATWILSTSEPKGPKGLLNSISIAGSDNPLVEVEYKGKQSNVILTTQGESTLKIFGE